MCLIAWKEPLFHLKNMRRIVLQVFLRALVKKELIFLFFSLIQQFKNIKWKDYSNFWFRLSYFFIFRGEIVYVSYHDLCNLFFRFGSATDWCLAVSERNVTFSCLLSNDKSSAILVNPELKIPLRNNIPENDKFCFLWNDVKKFVPSWCKKHKEQSPVPNKWLSSISDSSWLTIIYL